MEKLVEPEEEYAALNAVLRTRRETGLIQSGIDQRMGTTTNQCGIVLVAVPYQPEAFPPFCDIEKLRPCLREKIGGQSHVNYFLTQSAPPSAQRISIGIYHLMIQ